MDAAAIIARLGLKPHPEGGHFVETYRHHTGAGQPNAPVRGAMTAIYFLLQAGERSHWHRVDATEIWHFYAGAPLTLELSPDGKQVRAETLGPDLALGQQPQIIVPDGWWQAAESRGAWTLVGCTVGPAFEFSGFELAPKGWAPG